MSLKEYHKKRKFSKTPEPEGEERKLGGPLTFVIQKHEASRLHYDFRLELDGVLKSWAVPKGPSLNPHDRRLAVMVEDHPLDYAHFEGIIPKGNYGGGTVMVWDYGVYTPYDATTRKEAEKKLHEDLKKGHLTFILLGQKLKGEFALIKTHSEEENAWILIKKGDEFASEKKDITREDRSALSGKTMSEIRTGAQMPHALAPMLAQTAEEPFNREGWIFEIKYDGYRAIAEIESGRVNIYSRNHLSYNEKFAPIAESLKKFPGNAVLDGEIVVVDSLGHPHFQWVQDYPNNKGELLYYIFDILYLDGKDLSSTPLLKRKELLQQILPPLKHIKFSGHIEKAGKAMFEQAQNLGLEGIIGKKADSTYQQGVRSHDWLKIKTQQTLECVIAGFTEPKGGRTCFGALVAGVYRKGKLEYIGHIGGISGEQVIKSLYEKMIKRKQKKCPFEIKPETNAPATWIKPELVIEVKFSNWTAEGQLRHPLFLRIREDKSVDEVNIESRTIVLSHSSKIFFPEDGYTKGDIYTYYKEIAPIILPYLKDRPESLLRYPNGITGESFYQKNTDLFKEDWVTKVSIYSESNEKNIEYLVCQDSATLLYLINLGCIDLNPWSSRIGHLDHPDYLIIDLDPEKTTFAHVVKTAQAVNEVLEEWGITGYPKTSGATGIHIYIPLNAKYTYEQARQFAELICIHTHNRIPNITSMVRNPKERQGLVYLDYLQNRQGQTLASVYSVRAKPKAPVSTPLNWSEVNTKLDPTKFTIKNTLKRIEKNGDLFKPVLGKGIDLEKIIKKISGS